MKKKLEGIGDVVKIITDTLGIEQCEKCKERQAALNRFFPFLTLTKKELTTKEMEIIELGTDEERHNLHNDIYGLDLKFCDTCTRIKLEVREKLEVQMFSQKDINSLR